MARSFRTRLWIFVCAGFFIFYIFIEPHWIKIHRIRLVNQDLPASFDGTNIAFISDIHHGPYFSLRRVKRLVAKVNGLQPDIAIFGGDYVHRDAKYIVPCFGELRNVKAPLGKFGVLGNHDHWEGAALTRKSMAGAGISLLDNRAAWIYRDGARIKIGGVGDLTEDFQDLAPTLEDIREDDFIILVSHNPDFAEQLTTRKVDVMLCGHTHGGQVALFGLWAPLVPSRYGQKYRTGIVDTALTKVIISNGIGTITPPVRFFARPEIILLTLKRAGA